MPVSPDDKRVSAGGVKVSETVELSSRRVLVVGASTGIGRAFACQALAQGAQVCVAARRTSELDDLCRKAGGGTPLVADVTVPGDAQRLVDEAAAALGGIDLVLYAAGVGTLAPMAEPDAGAWARDYAVNVIGATQVAAAALTHLDPGGLIAFLSSDSTLRPRWGLSSYTASKAALDATIRSWRLEHPERRFLRIVMGATIPTDFGATFTDDVLGVALEHWGTAGVSDAFMDTDEVGRHLLEVLGAILDHPDIDVPDLCLVPRGRAVGGEQEGLDGSQSASFVEE